MLSLLAALVCGIGCAAGCATSQTGAEMPDGLVGEPSRPARTADVSDEPNPETVREGALWYRIAVEGTEFAITLRLLQPARSSSFFLPNPERHQAAATRALTFEGATGPEGPVPHDQLPDAGRIDVATANHDWVELHYRVDLEAFPDDTPRPAPDIAEETILAYLSSLLVVPSRRIAERIREIPVELHVPRSWNLRATWTRGERAGSDDDGREVHGFVVSDIRALRDAYFVTGPDLSTHQSSDGSVVAIFEPGLDISESKFVKLVEQIAVAYRERLGDVGPMLVYARSAGTGAAPGLRGTAQRNGFVVDLPERRPLRAEAAILVAHEAFHLWNGHRAIPDPDAEPAVRWFEEGVTHYMAVKTLYEVGRIDFSDVRRQLAESTFYYRHNPASGDGDATRLDIDRLPYDRGMLLALALDGSLYRCTNGTASLASWLGPLIDEEPTHYDAERLKSTYFASAGADCESGRRIWRESVANGGSLEPSRLLDAVGLHYIEASTVEETRVLPLDRNRRLYESLFERDDRDRPAPSNRTSSRARIP